MASELCEFARSSNGDRWLIGRHQITGFAYVVHEANKPSGGTVTELDLAAFPHGQRFAPGSGAAAAPYWRVGN